MSGPIETVYHGLRFRSRLEARWAVFFDALGVEYQYEKEGYEVGEYRYLPDFYLPQFCCFAEVKGDPQWFVKDHDRMASMLDFGSPLPHITNSVDNDKGGLILLGDIPAKAYGRVFHPIIRHRKGLQRHLCEFVMTTGDKPGVYVANRTDLKWIHFIAGRRIDIEYWDSSSGGDNPDAMWGVSAISVPARMEYPGISAAYDKARQARFEFGDALVA